MKKIDLYDAVRHLFAFRPDEAYTLDEVYANLKSWQGRACVLRKGELCVRAGTKAKEALVVLSGILHVKLRSDIGEDILMKALMPGEYYGLPLVFVPQQTHLYDLVAAEESEVLFFNPEGVRQWRSDPRSRPLFDYLARHLTDELVEAQMKNFILSAHDIEERLRRYLAFRVQKEQSHTICLPGTLADLADYLALNRSALSRAISRMKSAGMLDYSRNVFTIRG